MRAAAARPNLSVVPPLVRERPTEVVVVSCDRLARHAAAEALRDDGRFHVLLVSAQPEAGLLAIAALGPRVAVAGPGLDGGAIIKLLVGLREQPAATRVVALVSLEESDEMLFRLVAAGVAGLLDADAPAGQLVSAVADVAAGRDVIAPAIQGALVRRLRADGLRRRAGSEG